MHKIWCGNYGDCYDVSMVLCVQVSAGPTPDRLHGSRRPGCDVWRGRAGQHSQGDDNQGPQSIRNTEVLAKNGEIFFCVCKYKALCDMCYAMFCMSLVIYHCAVCAILLDIFMKGISFLVFYYQHAPFLHFSLPTRLINITLWFNFD